jgi:hypothetical protein
VLHQLFVVAICFLADRPFRGDVSNDKFSGCSSTIFSGEPFSLYPFTLLLSLTLYSSLVSRCFVRVTCPIHPFIQSKVIEPSIHPINRVLVVWVGLASRKHVQVVSSGVILSGWENYHMLYFMDIYCWRYSWLTLMLIIKNWIKQRHRWVILSVLQRLTCVP